MKNIMIENVVASDLLTKLTAYRTKQNSIRFVIGMKNLGDGLAAQASVVNGGQMAQIGFKTSLPVDGADALESAPYMAFNLKADDFCNGLSALLSYKADVSLSFDETLVVLSVGEMAEIPLKTIPEDACEPLLMQDQKRAWAKIQVKADAFLTLFRKGGFLSTSEADIVRKITDRVVLKLSANSCCMYSSDAFSVAKAWCNADVTFEDAQRALYHLRLKEESLSAEERKKMAEEMSKYKEDAAGMIVYARENHGYVSNQELQITIPNACVSTMQSIIKGADNLMIMITPDNIHMLAGNVLATCSLAGDVSSIYQKTVDPWEKSQWTAKVVVDKEALVRAFGVLRLAGEDKVPFRMSVDNGGLVMDKSGNVVHTTLLATEGNIGNINVFYPVHKVMDALSKLSNGNLVLRFMTENDRYPLSISNGSLEEDTIDSYAYILPVNKPEASGAAE